MSFSIDDELTWRVTPEYPVRELDGMDWERCASLHNLIVRIGWAVSGKPETELPRTTWWQRHITNPALEDEWSRRLSPSVKLFLRAALETPLEQNFFYYAWGLTWPQALFIQQHEDEGIMTLYEMTQLGIGGHRDGLNFDQETSLAIFQLDILDTFKTTNGRIIWDPLEVILSSWLNMIDTGKVVAKREPVSDSWASKPWELMPYSQHDLQTAVNGFDNLAIAIECLMENPSLKTKDSPDNQAKLLALAAAKFDVPREFGLVSEELLDSAGLKEGFIRNFLTSVRRPNERIKYIAPGLRLPTGDDFSPHALQNFEIPDSIKFDNPVLPIPLFISDIKSTGPMFELFPFQDIVDLPHGLWTTYVERDGSHVFEDACRLYLPFEIGAGGWACLADDSLVGENQGSKGVARPNGRKNELYQLGYNHYIPAHEPQLGDILELWQNLVGMGEWEVGEDGVLGGIERFKEADTEEHYYKYQLFAKW